ncbi:MAG: tRNA (guanosine(46)-N7)-methyltransferase TrmB [Spirochaetales bacterium]|nr:tRNA (guanosine(46)-N7)-methyltransferase TrmB [Spirochaetales bacterium]
MSEKRVIKSYVLRAGRMSSGQKAAYDTLKDAHCIPYEEKPIEFKRIFPDVDDFFLEIGFGMGDVTHVIARENPHNGYIGIEVHKPGVGKLLAEIENRGLKNLKAIEHDAVEVLENMIPDESITGIHVFFPDPWHKKKHNKRRLIQPEFTALLARKLKKGGYLYAVSDWEDYAEQILSVFSGEKSLKNKYESWADPQEWRTQTKFERKGLKKDHLIREVFFEKI